MSESKYALVPAVEPPKPIAGAKKMMPDQIPIGTGERKPPEELSPAVAERQRRREKIRAYLGEKHRRYLPWYDGAIYTHADLQNPDRLRQAAHSLRDLSTQVVYDLLPGALVEKIKRAKSKGKSLKNSFADAIELAIARAETISDIHPSVKPHLQEIAEQWAKVHRRLVAIAHNGTDDSAELTRLLEDFEDLIWASFQATPERVQGIDALLLIPKPDSKTLKAALRLLTKPAAKDYFYDRLEHPGWFEPLTQAREFSNPPGLRRTGDTIQFPPWSALSYLKRVGPGSPSPMVRIIKGLGNIDNAYVMGELVGILKALPVVESSKVLNIVQKWLGQPYQLFLHHKSVELFDHHVANKAWPSALCLMRGLTVVNPTPPPQGKTYFESRGFADDDESEHFILKHLPPVTAAMPAEVAWHLEKTLSQAIAWEHRYQGRRGRSRDSSHWRSTIEDSNQNLRHGNFKDALLIGLRDALTALGEARHARFAETVKRFLCHKEWIFRRLAIDAICRNRANFPELSDGLLKTIPFTSKTAYFELYHEYHHFLSEALGELSPTEREEFLDRLAKNLRHKWDGTRENGKSAHQLHRFLLGVAKHLSAGSKYQKLLSQMNEVLGPPDMDPSLLVQFSPATWVGPESPLSKEQVIQLSVPDLIEKLKTFKEKDEHHAPSAAGLGMALGDAVKADPKKYVDSLTQFADASLKPIYLTHLLQGLEGALQAKRAFDWNPILKLSKILTERKSPEDLPSEMDPEEVNEGVFGAISRLFQAGFTAEVGRMSIAEAEAARDILLDILAHPIGPGEKRYSDGERDATAASINTFHGKAIHALMRYLIYRWHLLSPGKLMKRVDGLSSILTPEMRAALEAQIESPRATPAVHAALGWFYPVLVSIDPDWAKATQEKIFDKTRPSLWEGAWDGYICFNQVYADVLEQMRPHYELAIKVIPDRMANNREDKESLNHLAQHLLIAKAFGLGFGPGIDLLTAFYEKAGPELRQHAAWFITRCLDEDKPKPRAWSALKSVIESRVAWAETTKDLTVIGDEIVALADGLKFAPVSLTELESLLRRMFPFFQGRRFAEETVQFLCEKAKAEPLLALDLLAELFSKRFGQFDLWSSEDTLIRTLTEAKKSTDEAVRQKAAAIATMFFEAGRLSFRDLLA